MEVKSRHGVCTEIRVLAILIRRLLDSVDAPDRSALTGGQCHIIGYIMHNRGRDVYQKDIEAEFHIRRSTATRALQAMERSGLITRESDARDARLKKLKLTQRSIDMSHIVEKQLAAVEQKLLCGVTDEERLEFIRISEKIRRNAERMDPGGEECLKHC